MRKLIWLMLLVSGWSSAAEKNVTLTPIMTPITHSWGRSL
jgi:Na+/H+ antiporter NhaD/arsenite permease-like protein